jgi:hypothetical protein
MIEKMGEQLRTWFKHRHMKAFPVIVANKDMRAGGQILMQVGVYTIYNFKRAWEMVSVQHKKLIRSQIYKIPSGSRTRQAKAQHHDNGLQTQLDPNDEKGQS